jgi:hypothetical protein
MDAIGVGEVRHQVGDACIGVREGGAGEGVDVCRAASEGLGDTPRLKWRR